MDKFNNRDGLPVLMRMVRAVQDNKTLLGDIDGLLGDGDHGMNMNKGFTRFAERAAGKTPGFTEGLAELGGVLLSEIGGSMGPIYGTLFLEMADRGGALEKIGLRELTDMLERGRAGLFELVDARLGDKTLMDTLIPALEALRDACATGKDFARGLEDMRAAAAAGRESTRDMTARYGRASRLGERSRGVPDAGAVSCCLLLTAMADGMQALLDAGEEGL